MLIVCIWLTDGIVSRMTDSMSDKQQKILNDNFDKCLTCLACLYIRDACYVYYQHVYMINIYGYKYNSWSVAVGNSIGDFIATPIKRIIAFLQ